MAGVPDDHRKEGKIKQAGLKADISRYRWMDGWMDGWIKQPLHRAAFTHRRF